MTPCRRNIAAFALLIAFGAVGIFSLAACSRTEGPSGDMHQEQPAISHYTCPMHPQIHSDKPGECPICHMTLVPIYKEEAPSKPRSGGPTLRISPERQQLIGLKVAVASRKPAHKEIRTVGYVAFDPALAITQREFLEIVRHAPSLQTAAVSRLKLQGMGDAEIKTLQKSRKSSSNLYLPTPGETLWVYATLYQEEMDLVPIGTTATLTMPSGSGQTFTGTVKAIDPVLDPATRSARARIEVPHAGGTLRPDMYLNVSLQIDLGYALTIPRSAIIATGTRMVAFVVQDDQQFLLRTITTGPQVGDDVIVLDGIVEGERVAANALFLIDSESQLKAALSHAGGHS